MYMLYSLCICMYKGLYMIDIEMVGLYEVLEGKCLKALLRGFYFDLRKYHT